ncbi:helix-turn-helix domain-containing protein [Caproicibacterium amylolyticum]|nr:helix-turn-helix transcriptional regulator [Caproicibacterium amylolyticum]
MSRKKYTVETLAERSLASTKTIQRMRNDENYTPKLGTVVAVCIGLQLHPILSGDLIKKSGLAFKYTEEHTAYQFILSTHFRSSIYECNKKLACCGFKSIGREE